MKGGLIETYKILTGKENIDHKKFFTLRERKLNENIQTKITEVYLTDNVLSVRVVNAWNCLPDQVVSAPSVNSFKSHLDRYYSNRHGAQNLHHPNVTSFFLKYNYGHLL